MVMKGGGERSANPNIERKQCLEFALLNPGEICKNLAGAYNSNSHARGLHYLTFVCGKQAEKSIQWGTSF
jgi:hypothetical protein